MMPLLMPATMNPAARPPAPIRLASMTPRQSARRPMKMPPTPKPTMSSVYGSDASARATPNSFCTAGKTTAMTYIALLPIVISASATARRVQAWRESACGATVAGVLTRGAPKGSSQAARARALAAARRADSSSAYFAEARRIEPRG